MEYKIISIKVEETLLGTQFENTAEKLAALVNEQIVGGWEPQGGVGVGATRNLKAPYLFQALVKRR